MRKIIVMAFVTLDGVMQAPGGPKEDGENGFKHGGWVVPNFDEVVGAKTGELFAAPFDLLLGRKTYDIFEKHWPVVAKDPVAAGVGPEEGELGRKFDRVTKYVATHHPETLRWQNSVGLSKDLLSDIKKLKSADGPPLVTQGSSQLVQTLFANDLVDELRLFVFPLVLGAGKRLIGANAFPVSLEVVESAVTPSGVFAVTYKRQGEIKVGSFELS